MIRIKNYLAVSCFVFCLCLIIPSLCFAEKLPEKKSIDNTDSSNTVSTPKKQDNPQAGNVSDKSTANTIAPPEQTDKERETEEEQDIMEKALDLLEVADRLVSIEIIITLWRPAIFSLIISHNLFFQQIASLKLNEAKIYLITTLRHR